MQIIKLAITFFLFSFAGLCSGQNQSDFILLTDSSYVTGDVSIKNDQIQLLSQPLNKLQFYHLEQIQAFRYQDNLYEVVKKFAVTYTISRKKSKDYHIEIAYARVKIQGTINLYEFGFYVENHLGEWRITENNGFFTGGGAPTFRTAPGGNTTMAMIPAGTLAGNGPYLVTQYLLKRAGSNEVAAVPADVHPEKFQEWMASYFADYEGLAYGIKKGDYTYEQIEDIINKYNLWVKQHPDAARLMEQKAGRSNGF